MVKFRPISYNTDDFRAFRLSSGTTSMREGQFCKLAASTTRHKMVATLMAAGATFDPSYTGSGLGTLSVGDAGDVFVVWREDTDVENIGATLLAGDEVIGMPILRGREFEVHNTCLHNSSLAVYTTIGQKVWLGKTGKLTTFATSTRILVGECTGTFNSVWLRVRVK